MFLIHCSNFFKFKIKPKKNKKYKYIKQERGQKLAEQWGCPFYEASAKTKVNHEECFYQVVREIRKLNQKQEAAKEKQKEGFFSRCIIL